MLPGCVSTLSRGHQRFQIVAAFGIDDGLFDLIQEQNKIIVEGVEPTAVDEPLSQDQLPLADGGAHADGFG
ncbi:hypothetical protein C2W62_51125, partial [Candidatus Entotheonella serta]